MYDRRSLRLRTLPRLLLAPLALFGLTACGVEFSSTFEGTEIFKGISLTGERTTGSELTVTLTLNPSYPVPVRIACYYEDDDTLTDDQEKLAFHDRAIPAGSTVIEPSPNATPGEELERRELSFTFVVEQPGEYFIACLTPAAPENGLGVDFTITRP